MSDTKKANRMGRTGSKPAPVPQAPQVLSWVPSRGWLTPHLTPRTGGYKLRKGTL